MEISGKKTSLEIFWRNQLFFGEALTLLQDGWLYQPLQAGGAQTNPVPAETGLRNSH